MAYLVLVRHGESVWNDKGLWTGLTDVPLALDGFKEAKKDGEILNHIEFDYAFTSVLLRTKQTFNEMKEFLEQPTLTATATPALNERDYGELTGKNKWDVEKQYGEEQFQNWRRGWDVPVPGGETLKDVYCRVIPYYNEEILPLVRMGKNVLVVASGNSLRALVKYIESISDEAVADLSITPGEVYIYEINHNGQVVKKEIKNANLKNL